ncbi:MAG TPA: zinc-ribbon domain-containing protein [Verrucomicrobiae bacterium]|nr:zinc-ribbon domain-containing protein [Verrucomicrobiae bacterium]
MPCPNCHQPLTPGATFCGNCGFKLDTVPVNPSTPQAATPTPSSTPAAVPSVSPTVITPQQPPQPATPTEPSAVTPPQFSQFSPSPVPTDPLTENAPFTPPQMANVPIGKPPTGHGRLAIAALVIGIVGIVCFWIPFLDAILGIVAIVFGVVSLRSHRHGLALTGTILGSLVILISLVWIGWIGHIASQQNKTNANSSSATLQTISTPCYVAKIPKAMKLTQTAGSCTFQATDVTSGEMYLVKVISVPGLTTTNLPAGAQTDARNVINATPGGTIANEHSDSFVNNPAYTVTLTASDGSAGTLDYVYKATAQGDLVAIMHTQRSGKDYSLSTIENNWSWR